MKLDGREWSVAVAYRLGLSFLPAPIDCSGCGRLLDAQALHSIRCGSDDGRVKRHNDLRDFFFNECQHAFVAPVKEPRNLVRSSDQRPADWAIPDYRPGRLMAYDLAVVDPTQVAYVARSAAHALVTAEAYADVKRANYADALSRDRSILFTPIIIESFGA